MYGNEGVRRKNFTMNLDNKRNLENNQCQRFLLMKFFINCCEKKKMGFIQTIEFFVKIEE
jgi:hypothetical protein